MRFIRSEPSSSEPCSISCGRPGIMDAILERGPLGGAGAGVSGAAREGGAGGEGVHVHDVLDLFTPVADAELALLELLRHLLLLVWVLRRNVLHMLHEPLDITKAEQFRDERLRRKSFKVVKVFANTEKDYGSFRGSDSG